MECLTRLNASLEEVRAIAIDIITEASQSQINTIARWVGLPPGNNTRQRLLENFNRKGDYSIPIPRYVKLSSGEDGDIFKLVDSASVPAVDRPRIVKLGKNLVEKHYSTVIPLGELTHAIKRGDVDPITQMELDMDDFENGEIIQCKDSGRFMTTDYIDKIVELGVCPLCKNPIGILTGNMPRGSMTIGVYDDISIEYKGKIYDVIEIGYNFPSGIVDGKPYKQRTQTAYLPHNETGLILLRLFIIAFKRRLMFSMGDSVTSGLFGVVFAIHIRTTFNPGPHGWPDDTYPFRVMGELADKHVEIDSEPPAYSSLEKSDWKVFITKKLYKLCVDATEFV